MTQFYDATLRDRLKAKRSSCSRDEEPPDLPATGLLAEEQVATIEFLARQAWEGSNDARARLYTALAPRLHRMGYILRPWPNTSQETGIWERDDVDQEGWIVFAELLAAWDGKVPFVPHLFARFPWRLRDRILRGIGKPLPRMGPVRVPEVLLSEVLSAHDSDQPESALLAERLMEHVLAGVMGSEFDTLDLHAVMTALQSPLFGLSPVVLTMPDDGDPFSQIEAA